MIFAVLGLDVSLSAYVTVNTCINCSFVHYLLSSIRQSVDGLVHEFCKSPNLPSLWHRHPMSFKFSFLSLSVEDMVTDVIWSSNVYKIFSFFV